MSEIKAEIIGVAQAIDAIKLMMISDKERKKFLSEASKMSRKKIQENQKSQVDFSGGKLKQRKNKKNKKKMFRKLFLSKTFKIKLEENEARLHFGKYQSTANFHHFGKRVTKKEFLETAKGKENEGTVNASKAQAKQLVDFGICDPVTKKKLNRSQIMKRMKFNQAGLILRKFYGYESTINKGFVNWSARPLASIDKDKIIEVANKILLNK